MIRVYAFVCFFYLSPRLQQQQPLILSQQTHHYHPLLAGPRPSSSHRHSTNRSLFFFLFLIQEHSFIVILYFNSSKPALCSASQSLTTAPRSVIPHDPLPQPPHKWKTPKGLIVCFHITYHTCNTVPPKTQKSP